MLFRKRFREETILESRSRSDITMYQKETGCEDVEWIYLAHDKGRWRAVVNAAMNLGDPYKAGNLTS
jgi:hypothetical protein